MLFEDFEVNIALSKAINGNISFNSLVEPEFKNRLVC